MPVDPFSLPDEPGTMLPPPASPPSVQPTKKEAPPPREESALTKAFSRLGSFIRANWKPVLGLVLVALVGLFIFFQLRELEKRNADLKTDLVAQRAQHMEEMRELTESFQRQQQAQAEIDRKFEGRLQELSVQYEEALTRIAQTRRTRQRQIEENPSTLPSVFENVFGIPSREGTQP